jgi:hypothetical protein
MGQAGKRRKVYPYYIVQTVSEISMCWVDARKRAFDILSEAREFIRDHLADKRSRILVVEENERRILE